MRSVHGSLENLTFYEYLPQLRRETGTNCPPNPATGYKTKVQVVLVRLRQLRRQKILPRQVSERLSVPSDWLARRCADPKHSQLSAVRPDIPARYDR